MSGDPRREHAVEHIYAALNAFEKAVRAAYAHQIPRLILWQIIHAFIHHVIHDIFRFAYAQAADGVTRQIHFDDLLSALLSVILIYASLHYAEQALVHTFSKDLALTAI